ncbi:MAG: hexitol phosphatase HxpB [Ignavibacteria bacterium]|nr:hexitol phosphatase HxpB [Ignavibacteria bacterium]
MIKAVIFDMDGIILDSEPFWKEVEIEIFNSLGVPLTAEMCESTTGMRLVDVTELWYSRYPWDNKIHSLDSIIKRIVDGLISKVREKGVMNKGVAELLDMFAEKKLPMAIASSSDMNIIDAVLDKFDIRKYFKAVHSAQNELYGKPHPAIYLTAAEKLGVEPIYCLAIEDSFNGVVSAVAARMKTAAYPEKTNFYNPKFAIADLKFRSLKDFTAEEFDKLDKIP